MDFISPPDNTFMHSGLFATVRQEFYENPQLFMEAHTVGVLSLKSSHPPGRPASQFGCHNDITTCPVFSIACVSQKRRGGPHTLPLN